MRDDDSRREDRIDELQVLGEIRGKSGAVLGGRIIAARPVMLPVMVQRLPATLLKSF
jgi:hypothetical protein